MKRKRLKWLDYDTKPNFTKFIPGNGAKNLLQFSQVRGFVIVILMSVDPQR